MNKIILGNNDIVLPTLADKFAKLIFIDPPFNTGKQQIRKLSSYQDSFDNFEGFLMPKIAAALRCLQRDGSLFVHLDYREVHYIKVAIDKLMGRDKFMNEIVWQYDYGARNKRKWSTKHDTILWYVMDPKNYTFNYDAMDRIPYLAPDLVGPEKAARGKTPTDCWHSGVDDKNETDVWWQTIVPTMGKEKTGYPTQKPVQLLERIVKVHTHPGDYVLDFFAGSGTTGDAAGRHNRRFVLVDQNPDAVAVMRKRLDRFAPIVEDINKAVG